VAEISTVAVYRTLLGSRIRSQLTYRASFAIDLVAAFMIALTEFIEIYVILHQVKSLGGLDLRQASFVFAVSNLAFGLGDMVFGQLDSIASYLRLGRLEAFLVRPMPLMAQLITADLQLRRLGRAAVGVVILVVVVGGLDIDWTAGRVYLMIITPLVGGAIFGGLFAIAGGLQFYLIDGAEFTNSFVYGGSYASQLPGSVLLTPLRVLFTFVIPATVVSYLPSLLIMGLPAPAGLPTWIGWGGPIFVVWTWLLAALAWRLGLRRFTGAGG
jgi:ABC-2 type transport system permease protein